MAAVDFLSGMLTCHVEYPCISIKRTTDHYRRIFQVERELLPDREIRSTLHTLAYRRDVPHGVRRHAFHSLLRSRPPDLLELLREGRYDDVSDAPLLQAKLDATSEIKVLDYTDIIRDIWEAPQGAAIRPDLVRVLASLGHREIVKILLPASFDASHEDIAQLSREALQNTGYSAEIEREGDRLHLLELSAEQEQAIQKLSALSEDLKALYSDIHDMNLNLLNSQGLSVSILSQLLHSDIYLRAKGSETALKLAVEFRILREISARIAPLEQEIRALIGLINVQIGIANQLLTQILIVEREMDICEQGIRQCEWEIDSCNSEIQSAESRAAYAESHYYSLSRPYWSGGSQSDRDEYEDACRDYEDEVSRCQEEIQSAQAEASAARSRRARAERQLYEYERRLEQAESEYNALGIELSAVEGQIAGLTAHLNGLHRQLADLQEQFRACEARIISIQQAFEKFSEETKNKQNSLSSRRRDLAVQQTSIGHKLTQAHTRRINVDKRIPLAKQEIGAVETRINTGKQKFDETAIRLLHETFVADEAAVANSSILKKNQETVDSQYWRIDWTIRNTLRSLPFQRQYGKTIDSIAMDIKRRKKL
jgi:predicted  nucleic acid-binding Zn-ribbon protein